MILWYNNVLWEREVYVLVITIKFIDIDESSNLINVVVVLIFLYVFVEIWI